MILTMSKKVSKKPDGQWGDISPASEIKPEDPIQKLIDEKDEMIKAKASPEELQAKEKAIWDAVYKKRARKMFR